MERVAIQLTYRISLFYHFFPPFFCQVSQQAWYAPPLSIHVVLLPCDVQAILTPFSETPTPGHSTSSLASLSFKEHLSLAKEHDGASKWGFRPLTTLSLSADVTPTSTVPRKVHKREDFSWLDENVVRESSVLGTKDTTVQVHPYLFTTSVLDLAKKEGVEVVYGTVVGLKPGSDEQGARYQVDYTPRGGEGVDVETIPASDVILAAGPWTGSLLSKLGLTSGAGRASAIDGSRAHSIVVKPPPGRKLPAQALFTSIKTKSGMRGGSTVEPEIYLRPDGTAYACGPTDHSSLPALASDVKVDTTATSSLFSQIVGLSSSHFSKEEGAEVVAEQACYLPVGSGDPVIGKVRGQDGVYIASGHSCWGICNGPGTGKVVAELVLDGKVSSADISRLLP
ncbi:DAO-domain-containing protein [Meredithblackwellia eburnea MCA 4105]